MDYQEALIDDGNAKMYDYGRTEIVRSNQQRMVMKNAMKQLGPGGAFMHNQVPRNGSNPPNRRPMRMQSLPPNSQTMMDPMQSMRRNYSLPLDHEMGMGGFDMSLESMMFMDAMMDGSIPAQSYFPRRFPIPGSMARGNRGMNRQFNAGMRLRNNLPSMNLRMDMPNGNMQYEDMPAQTDSRIERDLGSVSSSSNANETSATAPPANESSDSVQAKRKERAPSTTSFPTKLYKILCDPKYQECIGWLPHGRAWRVLKPKTFEEEVIPKYFRSDRYASFMRQVGAACYRF